MLSMWCLPLPLQAVFSGIASSELGPAAGNCPDGFSTRPELPGAVPDVVRDRPEASGSSPNEAFYRGRHDGPNQPTGARSGALRNELTISGATTTSLLGSHGV